METYGNTTEVDATRSQLSPGALLLLELLEAVDVPSGHPKTILNSIEGGSDEVLAELVSSGMVEAKTRQEYAREFIDRNREGVESTRQQLTYTNVHETIDDEMRSLLRQYDTELRVLALKDTEELRYRPVGKAAVSPV